MKQITIITEQISDESLAAVLPPAGVASVAVHRGRSVHVEEAAVENYRSFRNPDRFRPHFRVELVVDDETVDTVFDAIAFAYGAGFFGDGEAWVNPSDLALSA